MPGQVVQLQRSCWKAFTVGSFGLHRGRDVFDGCTVVAAVGPQKAFATIRRRVCRDGRTDRPDGCASAAGRLDDLNAARWRLRGPSWAGVDRSILSANPWRVEIDH